MGRCGARPTPLPLNCFPLPLAPALTACPALHTVPAGLQQPAADLEFRPAPADQAIAVASERELRAALAGGDLGWRDRRVVQLTADIQLSAPLAITTPVRLQGNCAAAAGGSRCCVLAGGGDAARPLPLLHVSGPAALVELACLELMGGVGEGSLAGALTASNHSMVELVGVRLTGNAADSGGAARVDSHATLTLTGCEVVGNTAQVGPRFFLSLAYWQRQREAGGSQAGSSHGWPGGGGRCFGSPRRGGREPRR